MDVYRCGKNGNLLDKTGGMVVMELHWRDIYRLLSGIVSVYRHMEFRRPTGGFAYEDKVWLRPLDARGLEQGQKNRQIVAAMDSGGDIYVSLSERAGADVKPFAISDYDINTLCDNPERFLERGLTVMRFVGLSALESERVDKANWPEMWREKALGYL